VGVPMGVDMARSVASVESVKATGLVLMHRDPAQYSGTPPWAWVHPNEIPNFRRGGWLLATAEEVEKYSRQQSPQAGAGIKSRRKWRALV